MTIERELDVKIAGSLARGGRRIQTVRKGLYELNGSILTKFKKNQRDRPAWEKDIAGWSVKSHGKNGMVLSNDDYVLVLYAKNEHEWRAWLDALTIAANHMIENHYVFQDQIGEGGFATVFKGYHRESGQRVAIKCIDKTGSSDHFLSREVSILKSLDCKQICSTYAVFETEDTLYLVLELMGGGSLFDYIDTNMSIPENDMRVAMQQILKGIAYMHEKGVAHRDIKPENILLLSPNRLDEVRIGDFGLSRFQQEGSLMRTMIGTPEFVAIEVLRDREYGCEVDLWSCGIMLYNLVTGGVPFEAEAVMTSFVEGNIKIPFHEHEWRKVSPAAQQFTRQLLCTDQRARLSALGALASPWFASGDWALLAKVQARSSNFGLISEFETPLNAENTWRCIPQGPVQRWRAAVCCVRMLVRSRLLNIAKYRASLSENELCTIDSVRTTGSSEWDFSEEEYECSSRAMSFASESTVTSTKSIGRAAAPILDIPGDILKRLSVLPESGPLEPRREGKFPFRSTFGRRAGHNPGMTGFSAACSEQDPGSFWIQRDSHQSTALSSQRSMASNRSDSSFGVMRLESADVRSQSTQNFKGESTPASSGACNLSEHPYSNEESKENDKSFSAESRPPRKAPAWWGKAKNAVQFIGVGKPSLRRQT